ncbi:hypothetical protein EOL96_04735 [Candidatus Saccharibacteria bacterium]|nr:hypothetical protein [Candidatus Saccharibacteria bacterium]
MMAFTAVQQKAKDTAAKSYANTVRQKAEVYYAEVSTYPITIDDFATYPTTELSDNDFTVTASKTTDYSVVQYKSCDATGAQIIYYAPSKESTVILPVGTASSTTEC